MVCEWISLRAYTELIVIACGSLTADRYPCCTLCYIYWWRIYTWQCSVSHCENCQRLPRGGKCSELASWKSGLKPDWISMGLYKKTNKTTPTTTKHLKVTKGNDRRNLRGHCHENNNFKATLSKGHYTRDGNKMLKCYYI